MKFCLSVGVPTRCGLAISRFRNCQRWALVVIALVTLSCLPAAVSAATLPAGFTETIISGLSSPTAMSFAPDGRLFVCQQGGALRVIKNGALLTTPFMTLTVNSSGERGLLGVAFDPNFATNKFLYVYYTVNTAPIHNRVSRFTANGDVVVPGSELIILELNNLSGATNHNGGAIHFGADGKLYIAVGENANPSHAQSFANLLGKMLRINPDPANLIPTDNPYFNDAAVTGNNKAIWALGLRNPFTFGFQRGTGRMFLNDVGQNAWEEINDGVAHSNYGWPTCEGNSCGSTPPTDYRAPAYVYNHSTGTPTGCAIVGGAFYNPITVQFPASYVGKYFFADLCTGFIRYVDSTVGPPIPSSTAFATGVSTPVDLQVSDDGSLWYLARGGTGHVGRIQFPAGQVPPTITQHPQSQTIAAGQPVTFNCSANGSTPLNFQWQRDMVDIPGATGTSYTIASVATTDDGAQFRCVVTNAFGSANSNNATLTVPTNTPPEPVITLPSVGTLYNAGDTINYSGTATDEEDPTVPASAFTWSVEFHHDTHTHPFIPPDSGETSGSFEIPTTGETAANVWYRIHLVVTDSGGLSTEVTRDVFPRTATLTLTTSPAGLSVLLDGQPKPDGYSELNVVNMQRTLTAPLTQTTNGITYNFVSWSDGGSITHNINMPATDTTYTANYVRAPNAGDVIISEFRFDGPNGPNDEFLELYNNTDVPFTVSTIDGSSGWSVGFAAFCSCFPNGEVVATYFVIPNGTVIPARGHFLFTNIHTNNQSTYVGYSLGDYGGPNQALGDAVSTLAGNAWNVNGATWEGYALFTTSDEGNWSLANRLDVVSGPFTANHPLFTSQNGIDLTADYNNPTAQYSWMRRMHTGIPQDTNNSANDFIVISNVGPFVRGDGTNITVPAILGAPSPENLSSPIQRNAAIKASLIEPQQANSAAPNRVRDATPNSCGGPNCALGTLDIRRRFRNSTGQPVTRLRFRIVDITTLNTPNPGGSQADLRLLTSSDLPIATSRGNLTVRGTIVEQPPNQAAGGGQNSSSVINLPGVIQPGASVDVRFVVGVQAGGSFRFLINVEALPGPGTGPSSKDLNSKRKH